MAATSSTTSLSGLGLTGLSSGLDTSGIITKLMAIEAAPQTQLKTQLTSLQTHTTALQSLNTAIAGIATTANAALGANALNSFAATTDSSAATATATSTASTGSISLTVDQLAASQVTVTDPITSFDSSQLGTITIRTGLPGSYHDTPITFASGDLDSVVAKINSSGAGITATKVAAGTATDGTPQYRLQFRGSTGEAGKFSVSLGSTWTSDASSVLNLHQVATAQNAKITLYPNSDVSTQVSSATNTFSSVLPGVGITVSAKSGDPVTVTVAADATAASTSAQALVAGLSSVFSGIAASTAVTTSASTSGGTSSSATSGGVFTGDTLVRTTNDLLLTAATGRLDNGKSPSEIGITLTKTGTVTFDQAKFTAAMTADPVGTTAMYQEIAGRVDRKSVV